MHLKLIQLRKQRPSFLATACHADANAKRRLLPLQYHLFVLLIINDEKINSVQYPLRFMAFQL
jgi:hypothetical protein